MADCKVIITSGTGGDLIGHEISIGSSQNPDTLEIINLLKENSFLNKDGEKITFWEIFKTNLLSSLQQGKIKQFSFKELNSYANDPNHKVVPNAVLGNLKERFTEVSFPEETEDFIYSNIPVLYMDEYQTPGKRHLYGRYLISSEEGTKEIFIVDRRGLDRLADYLTVLKNIKYNKDLEKLPKEDRDILLEIYKSLKDSKKIDFSSVEDFVIDFTRNRDTYGNMFVTIGEDNLNVRLLLDNICVEVLGISPRKSFTDPVVGNIRNAMDFKKRKNKDGEEINAATITTNSLLESISNDLFNTLALILSPGEIDNRKKVLDNIKKVFNGKISDNVETLKKTGLFGEFDETSQEAGWKLLFDYLTAFEPQFEYVFDNYNGKGTINLIRYTKNLSDVIGYDKSEVLEVPEYYNGHYILEHKSNREGTVYFVTRYYSDRNSLAKKFKSKEEAKKYIDSWKHINVIQLLYKYKTSESESTYTIKTSEYIPKGSVITLLDYKGLPKNPNILGRYNVKSREEFEHLVLTLVGMDEETQGIIINNLNTEEKAFLFLTKISSLSEEEFTEDNLINISREIGESEEKKYFFVVSLFNPEHSNNYEYKLMEFKPEARNASNPAPVTSVKTLLEAASQILTHNLGVDIKVMPQELLPLNPGILNNSKAFIMTDPKTGRTTVYINSTKATAQDLFHEYSHIFLAYLKLNNPEEYERLLTEVWDNGDENDRNNILTTYEGYAILDIYEEFFVDQFSKWVMGTKPKNLFQSNALNLFVKAVDTGNKTMDAQELFKEPILKVFTLFSNQIDGIIKNKGTIGKEFSERFKVDRLKSEWIKKLIKDNKLEEFDCE